MKPLEEQLEELRAKYKNETNEEKKQEYLRAGRFLKYILGRRKARHSDLLPASERL